MAQGISDQYSIQQQMQGLYATTANARTLPKANARTYTTTTTNARPMQQQMQRLYTTTTNAKTSPIQQQQRPPMQQQQMQRPPMRQQQMQRPPMQQQMQRPPMQQQQMQRPYATTIDHNYIKIR